MLDERIYTYVLPDENNEPVEKQGKRHSMVIIGANGSGKSKLGAWIGKQTPNNTHRISAQRALTFGNYIQQKSFEQATNCFFMKKRNLLMNMIAVGNGMEKNIIIHHLCFMIMRMYFLF